MYMETAKDMETQIYYRASMLDILHMGTGDLWIQDDFNCEKE